MKLRDFPITHFKISFWRLQKDSAPFSFIVAIKLSWKFLNNKGYNTISFKILLFNTTSLSCIQLTQRFSELNNARCTVPPFLEGCNKFCYNIVVVRSCGGFLNTVLLICKRFILSWNLYVFANLTTMQSSLRPRFVRHF